MLLAALLLIAQETPTAASPAPADAVASTTPVKAEPAQGWSVKVDPCASARGGAKDIVVCGSVDGTPRVPLPAERGPPDHPTPSNPDMSGMGALAAVPSPCAALTGGCQVGVDLFGMGAFLVRAVGKVVDPNSCCDRPGEATSAGMLAGDIIKGVGKAFKKKDKRPRIAIPLDDSPFPMPGATDATPETASVH